MQDANIIHLDHMAAFDKKSILILNLINETNKFLRAVFVCSGAMEQTTK